MRLFHVPPDLGFEGLRAALSATFRVEVEPARRVVRTLLDTFDWRVHQRGAELTHEVAGRMRRLAWRRGEQEHVLTGDAARVVRFAHALPEGAFRRRLEPILEMRALLPRVEVIGRSQALCVRNRDRKTVARLVYEENRAALPATRRSRALPPVLRLVPVRGYAKWHERAARVVGTELGLTPEPRSFFALALEAVGREAGDYSSRFELAVDPDQPAGEAVRAVLRRLFDVMVANETGIRDDVDTEFLHDFRVAIRRTRSAQGRFRALFPDRAFPTFRRRFSWLGGTTNLLRDLDVYLLGFEDYRSRLAPEAQPHLDAFRDFLREERTAAHRAVTRLLGAKRYLELKRTWSAYLEAERPLASLPAAAAEPIAPAARRHIARLHKRLLRDGAALGPETPAAEFHELRKTGKKLRYMMEFFRSLFPKDGVRDAIGALKQLQDNLGTHQDCEVHRMQLRRFSTRMLAAGKAPAETLLAMGTLVDDLHRRQHAAREQFAGCFARLAAPESRALFRDLFGRPRGGRDAS